MTDARCPSPAPRRRITPESVSAAALVVLLALGPGSPRTARAGLILTVNGSSAVQGGSGAFDVTVADTGGTFQVAGFGVELSLPAASGVSFTGVTVNTVAAPYLFGTLQSPPFTFDPFPNRDFSAGDFTVTPPGFVTLNPGDVWGLARVTYKVDPAAPGGPVTVSLLSAGTAFSDSNGDPVPITIANGTILLPQAVPEPSSIVLTGLGTLLVALARLMGAGARSA